MEKVSHSLLKRSFSSNPNAAFTSHKSVYDDVFGGPSKFGLPTLSPRLEDYSEIFGGFHASRSSSIPLLDLSLVDHDSDLHFDVRSPGFDYTMVFGNFGGSDITASFEDLVGQSSGGGYDSSDEPWSPAHSGSLSDELDPIAGSDKSHEISDDNVHETLQSIKQFNASYSKSSQRSMKTVLAATSHVTNFSAVPGYTFSHYESPVSWDGEDENCSLGIIDDVNYNKESGERVREENQSEISSNPSHNSFASQRNDCDPFEKHVNSTSPRRKPFVTVSDISLRTKPSRLPPPSRPPPRLVTINGKCDKSNSKLKASRTCAFERMADDSAQLFFDVEIDPTISAKVTEDGNNNVKVKHQSAKEPIERKYIWSHDTMQVGEKTDKIVRVSSAIEDEKLRQSLGKETTVLEPVIEDSLESTESSEANSGPLGVHSNQNAENSAGIVASDETIGYFEVIEKDISRQAFDIVEDSDTLMQQMNRDVHNLQEKREHDISKQEEDFQDFKVTKEAHRWVEESNQPQMNEEHYDCGNKQQQKIPSTRLSDQKGSPKTLTRINLACTYGINKIPENFQQLDECQKQEVNLSREVQPESEGNVNELEAKLQLKGSPERMNVEKGFLNPQITEQNNGKHKQNILREELQRRLEDMEGANTIREIAREITEAKGTENQHSLVCGKQNENKLVETYELKESDLILNVSGHDKSRDGHLASEKDMEAVRLIENEFTLGEALNQISSDKEHKLIHKKDASKERNRDASRTGDNFLRSGVTVTEAVKKEEAFETKGNMSMKRDAGSLEQLSGHAEELEPIERIWLESGVVERDLDNDVLIEGDQLKAFERAYRVDEVIAANVLGKQDDVQVLEATQAAFSSEENLELKTEPESSASTYESETGIVDTPAKRSCNESSKNKDDLQDKNTHSLRDNTVMSPCLPKQVPDSSICGTGMGISCLMRDKISSAVQYSHEPVKEMYSDDGIQKMNSAQFDGKRIDIMDNFNSDQMIRESVINGRKAEDPSSFLKQNDDTLFSKKNASSQWTERKNIIKDNLAAKNQKVEGKIRREAALEDELMRKIEEEREREREREKDRMSVDKAALEARERSYSEAHERAERAAVERATTEARKRALLEARERLEKASMEARLRAERAAVERATAEARQRATEKLMAQKAAYAFHGQVERSIPDRFSASTRTVDTRQSYVSSDLHFQSTGNSNGLRYSYSLVHEGAEGESPQRCKARLERCKRTAERAANALAEKNRRDLLAQREREERNRVAEALDVEVKRWSSGKEGNLRALLSTLQYILGPDSGWHPLPLTEVITSAAVKKAYRKATLCVHPDKLQQRGATIQQKYICEKVFDLLKEAWNKFNSEER